MTLLTPQERRVLLFLIASVLVGTAIRVYKAKNPSFAPELKGESDSQDAETHPSPIEDVLMGKININTASKRELESLPGIGPTYAERILVYRRENGPFRSKEEVMSVRGIGERRYRDLEPHITVE